MNRPDRTHDPECERVRHVLQSYLDGELDTGDTTMVADHLQHCDRCGIEASLYERVKASLGRLQRRPDPAALARLRRFSAEVPDRPVGDDSDDG